MPDAVPDAVPDKDLPRILALHVFKGSSYLIFNNLGIKETSVIPYRAPHRAPHRAPLGHRIGHLFVVPDKELLRFFSMTFFKLTQEVNRQPCHPLAPRSLCSFLCLSVGLTACLFVRQSVCPCVRLCVTGDGNKSETFHDKLFANRSLEGSPTCSPHSPPVSMLRSA